MVILLMTVGAALIALLAVLVTLVDLAGAAARRETAAARRRSWEDARRPRPAPVLSSSVPR